ncbi:MAG: hypothetical protein JSW11_07375 [Candidatus Heimdallarchaeota archaeon]|nr:MAG: hypothetical protein JSW11_07375 [Candidatus Heimdallarchaeota archaeon]
MSKRTVFEIGLMHDGFSVIRRQFFESADLYRNPILVGELLSAIQRFSTTSYSKIPEVFQIEGFTTSLYRFECGGEENSYLLYAIYQANTEYIRKTLMRLAIELKTYDTILLHWNIDTESLRNLYPIFDELFLPFNR